MDYNNKLLDHLLIGLSVDREQLVEVLAGIKMEKVVTLLRVISLRLLNNDESFLVESNQKLASHSCLAANNRLARLQAERCVNRPPLMSADSQICTYMDRKEEICSTGAQFKRRQIIY